VGKAMMEEDCSLCSFGTAQIRVHSRRRSERVGNCDQDGQIAN